MPTKNKNKNKTKILMRKQKFQLLEIYIYIFNYFNIKILYLNYTFFIFKNYFKIYFLQIKKIVLTLFHKSKFNFKTKDRF